MRVALTAMVVPRDSLIANVQLEPNSPCHSITATETNSIGSRSANPIAQTDTCGPSSIVSKYQRFLEISCCVGGGIPSKPLKSGRIAPTLPSWQNSRVMWSSKIVHYAFESKCLLSPSFQLIEMAMILCG